MLTPPTFAMIGAAGFVARRHLEGIRACGGTLVAAHDLHDSVGLLDGYFPATEFFLDVGDFISHLKSRSDGVDYLVICTPSYLHEEHCEIAATIGSAVIVEKPPALSAAGVRRLIDLQTRMARPIYPVLQLRYQDGLVSFRNAAREASGHQRYECSYLARRGPWYMQSWKGDDVRSGSILYTFGIHLFDVLVWTFGPHRSVSAEISPDGTKAWGTVEFMNATVEWLLSTRSDDLPADAKTSACRQIWNGGQLLADFSGNYADLHTSLYHAIVQGNAPKIDEALPSTILIDEARSSAGLMINA
jgi:UDP-N-acetyl-2-amino-2-deoxyglucuronate dehydrogenase